MVLVIDPQIAGISGDMLLCGLVDMGANKSKIMKGIDLAQIYLSGSLISKIDFHKIVKNGTESTELILDLNEDFHERKGIELQNCIVKISEEINLSDKAKKFAKSSIQTLMQAESKIHGIPFSSVHFHEAASIDTVIDIVGTAIALDDLKLLDEEIITLPVAIGGGSLTFSHGTTSNPASAILEIFRNSIIVIEGGQIKEELTTPTGACMLVNLAQSCADHYPKMKIKSIGYGAGKKNLDGFSNTVKLVHGDKVPNYHHDVVQVIETNLDDVSGEVLGNLIEKLMDLGAKDATITSAITKKGRPTNLVCVICDSKSMDSIVELLFSETGTLGIRIRPSDRITLARSIETVPINLQGKIYDIKCKISYNKETINDFKIESDDVKMIANTMNLSFKKTEELIRNKVKLKLGLE